MPELRSWVFDIGLAAVGCFVIFPAVLWHWPFEVESSVGPLLVAFAVSYAMVRAADRLVGEVEEEIERGRQNRRS